MVNEIRFTVTSPEARLSRSCDLVSRMGLAMFHAMVLVMLRTAANAVRLMTMRSLPEGRVKLRRLSSCERLHSIGGAIDD